MNSSLPTRLLEKVLSLGYFHPHEAIDGQVAIPAVWVKGTSPLILVLGENAGGKSFFRRLVQGMLARDFKEEIQETLHISMQGRTSGENRIVRLFVYGTEEDEATSTLSAATVTAGIKTAQERTHNVTLYWDEPDVGMSQSASAGVGLAIRQFIDDAPKHVPAVFLTSHSPALIAQLLRCQAKPHYVYLGRLGEENPDAETWLKNQQDPSRIVPLMPEDLRNKGIHQWGLIQKIRTKGKR